MLDALRRLGQYPLTRLQAWVLMLTFLAVLYFLFGISEVLAFIAFFFIVGGIPYLFQRYRKRRSRASAKQD